MKIQLSVAVIALGAMGCASKQTPVRVVAEPMAMSALVGEWSGEYSSPQTGRSGSILFRLKSVSDTAYGDVVMQPRKSAQQAVVTDPSAARGGVNPAASEVLTIRFVRLEGDRVIGRMDPYIDPDCSCRILTTFNGSFRGAAAIEGTFQSSGASPNTLTSGKWKVSRMAP